MRSCTIGMTVLKVILYLLKLKIDTHSNQNSKHIAGEHYMVQLLWKTVHLCISEKVKCASA